jgi:hypothetical protein
LNAEPTLCPAESPERYAFEFGELEDFSGGHWFRECGSKPEPGIVGAQLAFAWRHGRTIETALTLPRFRTFLFNGGRF